MFSRVLKSFLGILLIPAVTGAGISLYQNIKLLSMDSFSQAQLIFLGGIFAYACFHLFIFKPAYLYVFGHELIHVLAVWFCAGKVSSFKVSKDGGMIEASKANFFITLSPYFVPSYIVIFAIVYFVLSIFFETRNFNGCFIFLMGAAIAFHLVMTADVLKKKQTDILKTGYIFSMALIFLFNILIIGLIFSWLFEEVNAGFFLKQAYLNTKEIYIEVFNQLFSTTFQAN